MTVGELINWLKDFDGDEEVVIAEYQSRGNNFAYDVGEVEEGQYNDWDDEDGEEPKECVQIILGSQIGTMHGEEEW
jgi:hypothetical protein